MDLSPLLTSRTVAIVGLVCIALSALAALWAMVKLSYQRALGRPMPRNALTAGVLCAHLGWSAEHP